VETGATSTAAPARFCVLKGKLATPSSGMLEGITRRTILELAESAGIEVDEDGERRRTSKCGRNLHDEHRWWRDGDNPC
jgi:hypothetical protein